MVLSGINSSWFPGHMKLTKSLIKSNLSRVDLVINLVDARAPFSSMNSSILNFVQRKPFVVFLAKSDLADENSTKAWVKYFKINLGFFAFALDCKNSSQVEKGFSLARVHLETLKKLKFGSNMIRIMIVGISNVGKSTLINSLCGSKKAKVENRPGVTRSIQWISLKNGISLLDTPGVLPVEIENENKQFALQLIGAIDRQKIEVENLAIGLLNHLKTRGIDFFEQNFSKRLSCCENVFDWLNEFAKNRGMVLKGNEPDLVRASNFLIDCFRRGKFGKITLELPED